MSQDNFDDSVRAAEHANVNVNKFDLGDRAAKYIGIIIAVAIAQTLVIAACALIMGRNLARQSELEDKYAQMERQFRMTELKLDDWTVVAHRAGLQLSGDYTRGPQGALDAESFHVLKPQRSK